MSEEKMTWNVNANIKVHKVKSIKIKAESKEHKIKDN